MLDFKTISEFLKNFGFPIAVASWALWRLDKSWGSIHTTLQGIEDTLDRVEEQLNKNAEIQNELVTSMKIIQTFIGGEMRK
ncbi:hypothetical protein [Paenibacillus xylanexedens]|uniref:hypothetical protein n=1 Tax=Paenibacillus xylanexedens TaxID=528191 RepID=UPI000F5357D8|nr:hypothetical protein [Paenibacillus xylanexedens]